MEILFLSIFGLCAAFVIALVYFVATAVGVYTLGLASMAPWIALGVALVAWGLAYIRPPATSLPWTQSVGLPRAWPIGL